jgi:hypothetical protein
LLVASSAKAPPRQQAAIHTENAMVVTLNSTGDFCLMVAKRHTGKTYARKSMQASLFI